MVHVTGGVVLGDSVHTCQHLLWAHEVSAIHKIQVQCKKWQWNSVCLLYVIREQLYFTIFRTNTNTPILVFKVTWDANIYIYISKARVWLEIWATDTSLYRFFCVTLINIHKDEVEPVYSSEWSWPVMMLETMRGRMMSFSIRMRSSPGKPK